MTNSRFRAVRTMLPVVSQPLDDLAPPGINARVAAEWLTHFILDEIRTRRSMNAAVIGLSGGIDSAVTAYLCARALGPENVHAFRLPYATSSANSRPLPGLRPGPLVGAAAPSSTSVFHSPQASHFPC